MRKDSWKLNRPYKLEHQVLAIKAINFETETLILLETQFSYPQHTLQGFVDMSIHPLTADFKHIFINCQQCMIHRVSIDDVYEPHFTYHDPTLNISPEPSKKYNMEHFEGKHLDAVSASDIDSAGGELMVVVPNDMRSALIDLKPFRLIVEFSLSEPRGGVQFVVPDTDGTLLERGAHLFTYRTHNSSRLWFPCMDSYSEVCTWKLELTVDMYMVAVSCGDLLETTYTADLRRKTYHYYLPVPTAAPNIALSVGPFEIWVDPRMHEVTNFCLPGLLPVLKHTTAFLHEVFELYEELLSIRFPYSCYKQVFVDCASSEVSCYASMSICSYSLLHSKRVIEQTIETQTLLSEAVARQFFGCYVCMSSWCDAWLAEGLSYLLCKTYAIKTFANNVHLHSIAKMMESVCAYEKEHGPVVLDTGHAAAKGHPQALPWHYLLAHQQKSQLVMRMLERSVGREFMLQVMIKMLTLATAASKLDYPASDWSNMLVSTHSFLKHIFSVTGKDMQPFINQWVYQGGHVEIRSTFTFNRKRNTIELEVRQENSGKNCMKYVGPISVTVQELDGSFPYQFLIEDNRCKFDIACHSKSRRQKKKKIPIRTGEEIDINFADTDEDSPVLWLRIDAEMALLRVVRLEQADFMWQLLLRHEKCVVYQLQAIKALEGFPSLKTQNALVYAIQQGRFYHKVREQACFCLAKVMNSTGLSNVSSISSLFLSIFKSPCCPSLVRRNSFHNFKLYFLQKSFILAISKLRDSCDKCPLQVLTFLHELLFYNDNSINKYTDSYYKATLVEALSNTVSASISVNDDSDGTRHIADGLESNIRLILQDITRLFNMDKLIPSYRSVVTVSGLRAFRLLQRLRHLPREQGYLRSHARPGMFADVRLAALEALVDVVAVESDSATYDYLLDLLEDDRDSYVKFKVVCFLAKNPPFKEAHNALNTPHNKQRLWELINCKSSHDSRLRGALIDLFKVLYSKLKEGHEASHEDVCSLDSDQPTASVHSPAGFADSKDAKFDHNLFNISLFSSGDSPEGRRAEKTFPHASQHQAPPQHRATTHSTQLPVYTPHLSSFMLEDEDEDADDDDDGGGGGGGGGQEVGGKRGKMDSGFGRDGRLVKGDEGDLTLSESSSPGNVSRNKVNPNESHNSGINLSEEEEEDEDEEGEEYTHPTFYTEDSTSDVYASQASFSNEPTGLQSRKDEDEEDGDDDDFEEVTDADGRRDRREDDSSFQQVHDLT